MADDLVLPRPARRLRSLTEVRTFLRPVLVVWPAAGLVFGLAAHFLGWEHWAGPVWAAATAPVLVVLVIEIVVGLRRGDVGLDVIAALSMLAALLFAEYLAAAVVAVMYSGGQYLESFAERRASREMSALLARVPRTALRQRNGGLEEVSLEAIEPGDRLVIRKGDVVPVDGAVVDGTAVLDQSALTGESMPVRRKVGDPVLSGSTNAGEAFHLVAARRAAESTYAGIVRLVAAAQRSRAPMSRLADRYAMVFLAATVALAGAAWAWSGDPIRAVAVLVVATPCPLILAVPVALVSGLSRAAKHGILIKGGQALETLARVRSLVIDKTGTLTHGHARIVSIEVASGQSADELLRIAASLDQASQHIMAQTLVEAAQRKGLKLVVPGDVVETPGEGIEGLVQGHQVVVGGYRFVSERVLGIGLSLWRAERPAGAAAVAVGIDGKFAGALIFADELRAGTQALAAKAPVAGRRAHRARHRRSPRCRRDGREGPVDRCLAGGAHPRPENPGGLVRTQARPGHDDRRRRQRRPGAGGRRSGGGHGRKGRGRVGGSRRCRAAGRSARSHPAGDGDCAQRTIHCAAKRICGNWHVGRGNDRRGVRRHLRPCKAPSCRS